MICDGIRELSSPTWQPIETAPKDGTMLILHCPVDKSIWFARWAACGWIGGDEMGLRRDTFAEGVDVDFWQPLPPLPEGSGRTLADAHSKNPPEAEHG